MKLSRFLLSVVLLGTAWFGSFSAAQGADAIHVATNGSDSAAGTLAEPMLTVAAAAAKAYATPGTEVVVHPGTYTLEEVLVVSNGLTIASAEGPAVTALTCPSKSMDLVTLQDAGSTISGLALTMPKLYNYKTCLSVGADTIVTNCVIRDLYASGEYPHPIMLKGGTMVDCTVTNVQINYTYQSRTGIEMSSGLIDRCVIVDNYTKCDGGAVRMSGGTLRNSLVARNRSPKLGTGVTISKGNVENCTIVGNSCYSGADATATGLYQTGGTVVNTIVCGNTAVDGSAANVTKTKGTLTYSCMVPLVDETGNTDSVPKFADAANGDYRLEYCAATDAGTALDWHAGATDLSGARSRVVGDAVDMGCYESVKPALGCYFSISAYSGFAPLEMSATATVTGDTAGLNYKWYVNGGALPDFEGSDKSSIVWDYAPGHKGVRLIVENAAGDTNFFEVAGINVSPTVAYVDCTNVSGSAYPYDNEDNACTNIQEVLSSCLAGVEVRVKPGTNILYETVYLAGGTKLVSTDGPEVTTISCPKVKMSLLDIKDAGTVLSGFSVTMPYLNNNTTCLAIGTDAVVTNCIVRDLYAAGEYPHTIVLKGGTMVDCTVTNLVINHNYQSRTGIEMSSGLIDRCTIVDNSTKCDGGSVRMTGGTLRNSLVARNKSAGKGTGVTLSGNGRVENCTIVGNSCIDGTDATATGLYQEGGTVVNTIVYGNTALDGSIANVTKTKGTLTYSCMTPLVDETGNVDSAPKFADAESGDYRLEYCAAADAGTELDWHAGATDLSRTQDRVINDVVDMGCYESDKVSLGCSFTINTFSGFAPLSMSATATVVGDTVGLVYRWYLSGGDTPDFEGSDKASVSWLYPIGRHTVLLVVENSKHAVASNSVSGISVSPKVTYVDCNNTSGAGYPYDSEQNASTNIQDVLDSCLAGVEVRVKPGLYAFSDFVYLTGGTRIVSTDGPEVTELTCTNGLSALMDLKGEGTTLSGFAVSKAGGAEKSPPGLKVSEGSVITNCVIRNSGGWTYSDAVNVAGGTLVDCVVSNIVINYYYYSRVGVTLSDGLVDRCSIVDNSTLYTGGGAVRISGGTLRNSLIARNKSAGKGTGVTLSGNGRVENCTIVGNSCSDGTDATATGLYMTGGSVTNSIVYGNTSLDGSVANVGMTGGSIGFSCMIPLVDGLGNTNAVPKFADADAGDYRLEYCAAADAGTNLDWHAGATDLSQTKNRVLNDIVDMGCYESDPVTIGCSFTLNAHQGFAPLAMTATASVIGHTEGVVYRWYVSGGATPDFEGADKSSVSWSYSAGNHTVRLEVENSNHDKADYSIGDIAVSPTVAWLDAANAGGAAFPFDTEATAGTNVHQVLDACLAGVEIRVKPGTYEMTNLVYLSGGTRIVSTSGPRTTVFACRPSYPARFELRDSGSLLSGVTLTAPSEFDANNVLTVGTNAVVAGCIVRDMNVTCEHHEPIYVKGGTLSDSTVSNIVTRNGNQTHTGIGMTAGLVDRCVIVDNVATYGGGAVRMSGGTLRNSLVARNRSPKEGTGVTVSAGRVENCTVTGNACSSGESATATGVYASGGEFYNTIVYGNVSTNGGVANVYREGGNGSFKYSCMSPLVSNTGNIDADPLFRGRGPDPLRLQRLSPCVGAGDNDSYTGSISTDTDLRGFRRRIRARIDMGCYEDPLSGLILTVR